MAQVVEAEAWHTGLMACPGECLADGIATHRASVAADEHPVWSCPGGHVVREDRQDVRRDGDGAFARVGFGVGVESLLRGERFDAVAAYGDGACGQVHVCGLEGDDLATAEPAPGGEQDGRAVPGSDGVDERGELGGRGDRASPPTA